MPRPARIRKPKVARVPLAYQLNDELTSVATALIQKHEVHFNELRQMKIGYVMVSGGREPKRDRIDGVWARFIKSPPVWRSIAGYDAIVWVREAVWKMLSAHQREALLAHELSHGTTNDKGELTVVRHDLEDFAWVARHYGAWTENVELYGRQLSLFGKPDPNGRQDEAFADIDAGVAERKARGTVTPMRPRPARAGDQPVITP
jgi:hypothetical protein